MEKNWAEELVYVTTEDGIVHGGAKFTPAEGQSKPVAILLVHGIGGMFYYGVYTQVGRELASRGYTFVSGNNRGHDFAFGPVTTANGETRLQGAGWERFSESRYDIAAWVDYVASLGFERIVLLGHSYGAFKSVYYQGERQDPRIAAIVLCSPPIGVVRQAKPELIPIVEAMVAQGHGRDLLPWDIIPWSGGTFSAETALDIVRVNLDVFGVDNPEPLLARITCPMLAMFGTEEPQAGGPAELEIIKRNARASQQLDTMMIPGAGHDYMGSEHPLAQAVGDWMDSLVGESVAPGV